MGIIIDRGIVRLGMNRVDKEGNIIERKPATFEPNLEGMSLIVGPEDGDVTPVRVDCIDHLLLEIGKHVNFDYTASFRNSDPEESEWECSGCLESMYLQCDKNPKDEGYMFCPFCGRVIVYPEDED